LLSKVASARSGWITWLPTGESPGGRKPPTPSFMTAYALQVANEEGFAVTPSVIYSMSEAAERVEYNFDPKNTQERLEYKKLRCFSYFLSSLYSSQEAWRPVSFAADMEKYLQGFVTAKLSDEELGWLNLAAQKLPVCEYLRTNLRKRLDSFIELRLADNKTAGSTLGDAVNLLALISSDASSSKSTEIVQLAKRVERNGARGSWSTPVETAFAVIALCQLIDGKDSTQAVKTIPLPTENSFPTENRISIFDKRIDKFPEQSRSGILVKYAKNLKSDHSFNRGLAISREFQASGSESKLWQDQQGNWHTTAGSTIEGTISICPTERTDFVLLTEQIAGGLGAPEISLESGNLSEAPTEYESKPPWDMYEIWPQEIATKGNTLKVYTTAIGPRLYEFKYKVQAVYPGKYFVPPATVETIFNNSKSGSTSSTILFVH